MASSKCFFVPTLMMNFSPSSNSGQKFTFSLKNEDISKLMKCEMHLLVNFAIKMKDDS